MAQEQKPHYHGHRARLRGRLVKDQHALADYEILELILANAIERRDTKPLAKHLIERFGSLRDAMLVNPEKLKDIYGIGPTVIAQWHLIQELHARLNEAPMLEADALTSSEVVGQAAIARLGNKRTEEFWVALLDNQARVIEWKKVNSGTVDRVQTYPREIIAMALKLDAASLILVHNHPGGDPTPSEDDQLLTMGVIRAASTLDIEVRDHVVVAGDQYTSFYDKGLI